jgi:hypothetical protein
VGSAVARFPGSRLVANGDWYGDGASSPNGRERRGESDVLKGLNRIDCSVLTPARSIGISSSIELSSSDRIPSASFGLPVCFRGDRGDEGPAMGCSSSRGGDSRHFAISRDPERGRGAK